MLRSFSNKMLQAMRRLTIVTILSNAGEQPEEFLERLQEFMQDFVQSDSALMDALVGYAQHVEEVENRYAVKYLVALDQAPIFEDACLRAGFDFLPATEEFTEDEAQLYEWIYVDSQ